MKKNITPKSHAVSIKIIEIKKIRHYEKDYTQYGLKAKDIKKPTVNIGMRLSFDKKIGAVTIVFVPRFFYPETENELFGIEFQYKFKIFNMKRFAVSENEWRIPDVIMLNLFSIVISGTRGMLAALNTTPEYRNIYLPVLSREQILSLAQQK